MDGVLGSFFLIKPLFIYAATVDPPELFDLGNSLCNTTVYQRILGKVLLDGEDMNLEQIEAGLAWHYKYYQREQRAADRVCTGPGGVCLYGYPDTGQHCHLEIQGNVLESFGLEHVRNYLFSLTNVAFELQCTRIDVAFDHCPFTPIMCNEARQIETFARVHTEIHGDGIKTAKGTRFILALENPGAWSEYMTNAGQPGWRWSSGKSGQIKPARYLPPPLPNTGYSSAWVSYGIL